MSIATDPALVSETGSVRHGDARAPASAREAVPNQADAPPDLAALPRWQREFCLALRRHHGVVLLACESARVSRATAYRWRGTCPAFARAWDEALDDGRADEEGALFQAAVNGEFQPVYDGEVIVGYWKRRSIKAAVEFLKRRA